MYYIFNGNQSLVGQVATWAEAWDAVRNTCNYFIQKPDMDNAELMQVEAHEREHEAWEKFRREYIRREIL